MVTKGQICTGTISKHRYTTLNRDRKWHLAPCILPVQLTSLYSVLHYTFCFTIKGVLSCMNADVGVIYVAITY